MGEFEEHGKDIGIEKTEVEDGERIQSYDDLPLQYKIDIGVLT